MICSRLTFLIFLFLFYGFFASGFGQDVDHWETIVFNDDNWSYKIGSENIPLNWIEEDFDASQWETGRGGFGYGDGDDNTVLNDIISVFIIRKFYVPNNEPIVKLLLHADYDDGFVAYLNGAEIGRRNLGVVGQRVAYNESAPDYVEANRTLGLLPVEISVDADLLKNNINTLAIQIHNHGTSSSDLSSNFYLSAGISNTSSYFSPPPYWFNSFLFESTLPIVKITTENNQAVMDEPRIKAHMGIIYDESGSKNSTDGAFNHYDGSISIEYRGTSSQTYNKKGYGFETQNEDGSNNNVELLGMPSENDWVLHGPYADKSLLRNVLSYHMGNLTGRYAPRTKLCELFLNDAYEGVYVLTEKIKQDKNRVDIAKLTELDNEGDELTGGYMIKVDRNDQNIPGAGWYSTFPDNKFFAFVEPKDDDITSAQEDYIKQYMFNFESMMASSDYEELYNKYIDVESLVDYFLVTEISKQIDAYKLSFYMYKDKDSNGGKLQFGPLWDFNFGYGNFNFDCSPDPQGWAYEFPDCGSWHPFWARKLIDIPNVQHLSNCRWTELRAGPLQTDSLLTFIDERVAEMGDAVDRNFDRWQVLGQFVWANDFIGDDYEEELDFLKTWLTERLDWMDDNMLGDCGSFVSSTGESENIKLNVFPNPTSQYLNVSNMENEAVVLKVYSSENQLVKSINILSNSKEVLDVSHFSNGLYTLIFKSEKEGKTVFVDRVAIVK